MRVLKVVSAYLLLVLGSGSIIAQEKEQKELKKEAVVYKELSVDPLRAPSDKEIGDIIEAGKRADVLPFLAGYYDRLGDQHSFANPKVARTKHLDLDITIDFESQTITGTAEYDLDPNAGNEIVFDMKHLLIDKVQVDGQTVKHKYGSEDSLFGRALIVPLVENSSKVTISYRTTSMSPALQWLNERQASSPLKYLYTQGEAILTRSWIPIQDSPGIKITYEATVHVPEGYNVAMSAKRIEATAKRYKFKLDHPIPSYLIALAVGEFEFREISENCGIYANSEMIEMAANEFAETPEMIRIAEELVGPYIWDRYDMIVLPPAFPFGGMENPMLTFLTPTVIAGDRSLVSLIAHELAHSWSGNLVTNATWNDFWLNEGITVYLERRIIEAWHGRQAKHMNHYHGYNDLVSTINELGHTSEDTQLKLNLEGRDPDDGMTDVAYEKGALFMEFLEKSLGRDELDRMLKKYFEDFKYKALNTEQFVAYLKRNGAHLVLTDDVVMKWIYGKGLPEQAIEKPKSFQIMDHEFEGQLKRGEFDPKKMEMLTTPEWLYLLDMAMKMESVERPVFTGFWKYKDRLNSNAEIQTKWFLFLIRNGMDKQDEVIYDFLSRVGRRKFLVPIYRELLNSGKDKEIIKQKYLKVSPNYHSITQNTLDEMFGISFKERASLNEQ